ncbi:hypothetical protein LRAMOSA03275 [Lichtheimia ramosa]|uniref:Heterokaryon incompatibility domain-containing protein n=1 Tax=Lichtheimia ramosa TaxID=688394 RepID=A0A077WTV1_9FUNG|nr:hypothetical protein LRAMOSA03275 [Lichtheimia ramosa]
MLDYTFEDYVSLIQEKQNGSNVLSNKAQIELLQNPNFLLLYVPDDGSRMKLVKPADDSYHQKHVMEKSLITRSSRKLSLPHYALSHLWGISEENRHLWHEIGDYVDDEKGQPAAVVSMRPEKRETLLKLLEGHPDSYWWIDVLCARTDTPLDIMGDIYKYSRTCYAMLDCDSQCISDMQSLITQGKDPSTLTVDEFWHAVDIWDKFAQCAWWKRVWTWQEMMLPKQILLIAETDTQVCNTIDMDRLYNFEEGIYWAPGDIRQAHMQWESSTSYAPVMEIKSCLRQRSELQDQYSPHPITTIDYLTSSSRKCMKPEDYVYGVLGVFRFNLPRGIEPNKLWELFVSRVEAIEVTSLVSANAREFDLLTARDMADVYQALLKSHDQVYTQYFIV